MQETVVPKALRCGGQFGHREDASDEKPRLTKLKKGKTYYIKVRAYTLVNGKNVYGKFSSVQKVKIKK